MLLELYFNNKQKKLEDWQVTLLDISGHFLWNFRWDKLYATKDILVYTFLLYCV